MSPNGLNAGIAHFALLAGILLAVFCVGFICLVALGGLIAACERRSAERRTAIMRNCLEYDLSAAAHRYGRYLRGNGARAALHEREFRRFFALMALNPGIRFGLRSRPVREFWQCLAAGSPGTYREFCTVAAGQVIAFAPLEDDMTGYARTWEAYRLTYGAEPDAGVWPRPDAESLANVRVSRTSASYGSSDDGGSFPVISFGDSGGHGGSCHGGDGGSGDCGDGGGDGGGGGGE